MPVIQFKGKTAIESYHHTIPHHTLEFDPKLSVLPKGEKPSLDGNLIIEGDNLLALKALLPTHAGRIKCIYIDPPYNTGNEGWVYNDNLTQPQFKEWIGKTVGKEGEDFTRHDKWCCMMYPRLELLKDLLQDDGVIFVSIDDNELASLRMLLDEIYGADNFVGSIIWKNVTDNNPTNISVEHEYVVCYAKAKTRIASVWSASAYPIKEKLIALAEEYKKEFPKLEERQKEYTKWFSENKSYIWPFDRYRYIDDGGIYTGSQSVHNPGKEGYRYDVIHPITKKACQEPLMGYRFPRETMDKLLADKRILFGPDESKIIEIKLYVQEYKSKLPSVIEMDTRLGAYELRTIFPEQKRLFQFPKPSEFLKQFLQFATHNDDLILDSFAGSGTTGNAVLALNKQDGGQRRFVLIQMPWETKEQQTEKTNICKNITAERIRRVIRGKNTAALGGAFTYSHLGPALFGEYRDLGNRLPPYDELAKYVFYTETSQDFDKKALNLKAGKIGEYRKTSYYLLYTPNNKADQALSKEWMDSIEKSERNNNLVVYCEKIWIHRDDLAKYQKETGCKVRPMLIPFNLK